MAIAGVYQQGSVAYNRAITAGYCSDTLTGPEAREGCSVVRTANYDAESISQYCKNIESIAAQSLPLLLEEAKPENMEKDWITNFFDKCRLVSDEEMQKAWAKILAGEANAPGTFSKRTINFMASLDKQDAVLFTKLCGFNWIISGVYPLIYDLKAKIYTNNGITFGVLKHLDAIGLVSFENLAGYIRQGLPQTIIAIYKNTPYTLKFQKEKDNTLQIGCVLLTIVGEELSTICASDTIAEFDEYIIQEWGKEGIIVSPSTPLH